MTKWLYFSLFIIEVETLSKLLLHTENNADLYGIKIVRNDHAISHPYI